MNHHQQDSNRLQKRKQARGEQEESGKRRKQLISTHEDTTSNSDAIEITRIPANPPEDSTNYFEEEDEDDSCWSTNGGQEGRDQQDTSYTTTTTTATTPGDNTSYATRKTNHTNEGCDVESDKFNGQSDESGDPSSNDEDQRKQLRQHSDIEKRMEANRLRAKATRRKKKVMIDEMRSKIFVLTVENDKLKNQNRVQQTEIEFLRNIQGQQLQQVSLYDSNSEY